MITPVKITLSPTSEAAMKLHLRNRIRTLKSGLKELFESKLPNWRKIYEAVPREKKRTFPFENASNLVVPLAAIHKDTLKSRIMAAIFKTQPLWYFKAFGNHGGNAEPLRAALEDFMGYVGLEPTELDLYRVYDDALDDVISYGTVAIKAPWETSYLHMVVPAGDGTGSFTTKFNAFKQTIYDGPRPEKLQFEDFWIPPSSLTLDGADIKIHRRRLLKFELEERKFVKAYDPEKVDLVLNRPDRYGPITTIQQQQQESGTQTTPSLENAQWDIYECWFLYRINGMRVRCIASYHETSDTLLRAFYNFYPDSVEPFVCARLYKRDGCFHGYGFCEALSQFQEETSEQHNQRRDAMTVRNANILRANPDSKLHEGYKIYPGALIPAEKDEVEAIQFGEPSQLTMEDEGMSLELAERRSGVSPPQQGFGAGVMHGRRGVYTAMGTMSLLQEGNNRTELNVSDIRYMHTKLGRMMVKEYSYFGVGDRVELFGAQAEQIREGLNAIRAGTIGLPMSASTASINREVEKQNDIMLSGVMTKHYMMVSQILQATNNPIVPEAVRDYSVKVIKAADAMMKTILRHFGFDEVDRLVPEAQIEQSQSAPGAQASNPQMAGNAGGRLPVEMVAGPLQQLAENAIGERPQ